MFQSQIISISSLLISSKIFIRVQYILYTFGNTIENTEYRIQNAECRMQIQNANTKYKIQKIRITKLRIILHYPWYLVQIAVDFHRSFLPAQINYFLISHDRRTLTVRLHLMEDNPLPPFSPNPPPPLLIMVNCVLRSSEPNLPSKLTELTTLHENIENTG